VLETKTWFSGGSQDNSKTILLNSVPWSVTKNLEAALIQFRQCDQTRILWIDALAINQSDVAERSVQVAKMPVIYSMASTVCIWLGTGDELVTIAFSILQELNSDGCPKILDDLPNMTPDSRLHTIRAFAHICSLSYWRRVWVVQEVMYAQRALVVYGDHSLLYSKFLEFWDMVFDCAIGLGRTDERNEQHDLQLIFTTNTMKSGGPKSLPDLGSARHGVWLDLDQWMAMVPLKEATDPRDMIFGFYGCLDLDSRRLIQVDYSRDPIEVLIKMSHDLLKHSNSLDIFMQDSTLVQDSSPSPFPSWFPPLWLGKNKARMMTTPAFKHYHSSKDIPPIYDFLDQGKTLHTKGRVVATIGAIASSMHGTQHDGVYPKFEEDESPFDTVMSHFLRVWQTFNVPLNHWRMRDFLCAFHPSVLSKGEDEELTLAGLWGWLQDQNIGLDKGSELWLLNSMAHGNRRMFSCTFDGAESFLVYGLGPINLEVGDKVCVLLGCSFPVVLRPVEGYYTFLGNAFVPILRDGVAVTQIEAGSEEPMDFLIR
jgi:hypothetical protein